MDAELCLVPLGADGDGDSGLVGLMALEGRQQVRADVAETVLGTVTQLLVGGTPWVEGQLGIEQGYPLELTAKTTTTILIIMMMMILLLIYLSEASGAINT